MWDLSNVCLLQLYVMDVESARNSMLTSYFWGLAKGAEKASCGQTVVQKGAVAECISSLPP